VDFYMALMFEDCSQYLAIAKAAESLGYAGIALADHIAVPMDFASVHPSGENPFTPETNFPDTLTTMAAMAAVTTTLRFLPYVYILPMREPFSVAKQVGTVAMLSDHRVTLGVGAGWLREEIVLLGQEPGSRGARMDEMIEIVRRFWRDGTAEFHGRFYDFGPTGMYPKPDRPIPIWVGGKSDAALARAARNDGWLGMNYGLEEIDGLLSRLAMLRSAHVERHGPGELPFETLVIPNALPSRGLYEGLAERGVTSTVCMPWMVGDPAMASFDAKYDAMAAFADAYLVPSR
jgi:probable F420-dependent oxidoreductase